jgi:predicted extracellular nuclease
MSQIYGGGGNTGASLKNDFIELFNRGDGIADLTNWSVQYSAPGSSTWQVTQLSGTLAPGQYLLIQEAQGAGGTTNLPTPDAFGNDDLNATAGKVALVNNLTPLSGICPTA